MQMFVLVERKRGRRRPNKIWIDRIESEMRVTWAIERDVRRSSFMEV